MTHNTFVSGLQAGVYWMELMSYYSSGWSLVLMGLAEGIVFPWVYGRSLLHKLFHSVQSLMACLFSFCKSFICSSVLYFGCSGADRLMKDIEHMVGFKLGKHWYFCWKFVTPLLLIVRYSFEPKFLFFLGSTAVSFHIIGLLCDTKLFFFFWQVVLIINIIDFTPLAFDKYVLPGWAQFLGWGMATVSIVVIPIFAIGHIYLSYRDPDYDGLTFFQVRNQIDFCLLSHR